MMPAPRRAPEQLPGAAIVAGLSLTRPPTLVAVVLAAGVVFVFRMLSLHFGWRIPQARGERAARG